MIPTIAAKASGIAKVTAIEKTEVVMLEDCEYKKRVDSATARK
jgi:hypothetical protein